MELSKQVVSLELARRLKELGVKQVSAFWYEQTKTSGRNERRKEWKLYFNTKPHTENNIVSAFTVAELGEMLPYEINLPFKNGKPRRQKHSIQFGNYGNVRSRFYCGYRHYSARNNPYERAETEADARAKMLVYLLDNKLITHSNGSIAGGGP